MKKDLHPADYRPVVFQDENAGFSFLSKSTAKTDETIKWEDGNEYPLVKVYISSASHPFYTGEEKIVDVEGRVDRFKAQREAADKKRQALTNKAKKTAKTASEKSEPEVQKLGGTSRKQNKKPEKGQPQPDKKQDKQLAKSQPKSDSKPEQQKSETKAEDKPSQEKQDSTETKDQSE